MANLEPMDLPKLQRGCRWANGVFSTDRKKTISAVQKCETVLLSVKTRFTYGSGGAWFEELVWRWFTHGGRDFHDDKNRGYFEPSIFGRLNAIWPVKEKEVRSALRERQRYPLSSTRAILQRVHWWNCEGESMHTSVLFECWPIKARRENSIISLMPTLPNSTGGGRMGKQARLLWYQIRGYAGSIHTFYPTISCARRRRIGIFEV